MALTRSQPAAVPTVAAKEALEAFWGRSNGGNTAYRACEQALVDLKLSASELRKLRLELPVPESPGGTTAQRIVRLARMLELLESQ